MGDKRLKFAVFTDLHYDVIHDASRRLQEFLSLTKEEKVEFIIGLGDLCHPIEEHKHIIETLNEFIPYYSIIGNHDSDSYPIETVLKFFHLKNSYYSFVVQNIKFIMLDANYIRKACDDEPNYKCNYDAETDVYPFVPEEEIEWLNREIQDNQYYYIVCSHHGLTNDFRQRGIANRDRIRQILEHRNRQEKKVLLCMNGHDHGNDYKEINGISYYTLNSMSYIWHGIKPTFNYSMELHEKYPYMKDMILYEEPLHVIVTIDDNGNIRIDGVEGHYQNITPNEIGLGNTWNAVSIEPKTLSITIQYNREEKHYVEASETQLQL